MKQNVFRRSLRFQLALEIIGVEDMLFFREVEISIYIVKNNDMTTEPFAFPVFLIVGKHWPL